jgi:hypothetical protein
MTHIELDGSRAVIQAAEDADCVETALRYVLHAAKEEIWFWISKLLGVIGDTTDREIVKQNYPPISFLHFDNARYITSHKTTFLHPSLPGLRLSTTRRSFWALVT